MTRFKILGAAFALCLSTGTSALAADCCADQACCKEGAECCDHAKGKAGDHVGHAGETQHH